MSRGQKSFSQDFGLQRAQALAAAFFAEQPFATTSGALEVRNITKRILVSSVAEPTRFDSDLSNEKAYQFVFAVCRCGGQCESTLSNQRFLFAATGDESARCGKTLSSLSDFPMLDSLFPDTQLHPVYSIILKAKAEDDNFRASKLREHYSLSPPESVQRIARAFVEPAPL